MSAPAPVLCQCELACLFAKPCTDAATQEDWLCDPCRLAKDVIKENEDALHCHTCGQVIYYDDEGDFA